MERLLETIKSAQEQLKHSLDHILDCQGAFTTEQYSRYLSMQYHLTNGVEQHFYAIAGHKELESYPKLRKFLVKFAEEERPHYKIAFNDLKNMQCEPHEVMLEVKLWWAYFNEVIKTRPFVRLGATCILENISSRSDEVISKLLGSSKFITPKNTRFLEIHRHNELPHGDEILDYLTDAKLKEHHINDLLEGAKDGSKLFLGLLEWGLFPETEWKLIRSPR